jgi:DNA-binding transcriptional MerR regulator
MVAEIVGRSRRTVTHWIERGWLRASRAKNGWYWYVESDDLDRFMDTCRNQSGDYLPQLWQAELAKAWQESAATEQRHPPA